MKYTIKYSIFFYTDLAIIVDYLSQFSKSASSRFKSDLRKKIEFLKETPNLYESYRYAPAYRHIVNGAYILFYQVCEDKKEVLIYRILHGSKDIKNYL